MGGDLSLPGEADRIMENSKPDWIVHCAAASDVDDCEREPETAFRLNRDMARLVAQAARDAEVRFIHISTDAVFDGARGDYSESDPANPINIYGQSKLEGEQAVMEVNPEALVVRTNFYGWSALPGKGLAEWFLANLESGDDCYGFSDISIAPILVTDLADLLLRMLQKGLQGPYHVPGAECVSKHEFGVRLAKTFDLNSDGIRSASVQMAGLRAPRAHRLCLRGEKVEQDLGIRLPSLDEGLDRFMAQRESGYSEHLRILLGAAMAQTMPGESRPGAVKKGQ